MGALNVSQLNLTATGGRVKADFSNSVVPNRMMFQTSTLNDVTSVHCIPSGAGTSSGWHAHNGSDPLNAGRLSLLAGSVSAQIRSDAAGTGTYLPLEFYTGGVSRASIDANGVTSFAGNVILPSLNGGQLAGFRNKIINGKMDISQRNGGTVMALTATPTYFNDRWSCVSSDTPTGALYTGRTTIQGALGSVQLGDGFGNCLFFQRYSGSYAGTAKAIQVLETAESLSLAGRTVTLSFWAAVNTGWLGGGITAAVMTGTGTDQTAAQFLAGTATGQATAAATTVTPTTTLTKYRVQAVIPSGATQVAVFLQNAGWSGSGSSTDIIAITGIQLEVGSVATPFEHRHYGMELALCQRYYYRTTNNGGSTAYVGLLGGVSATRAIGSAVTTPQTMRSAVSQFEYSGLSVHALSTSSVGPVTAASIYGDIRGPSHSLDINVASGLSVGTPYMLGIAPNGFIGFSAEL